MGTGQTVLMILSSWARDTISAASFSNFQGGWVRKLVEVQATAENQVFDEEQLGKMIDLASQGVQQLIAKQQAVLGTLTLRQ